MTCSLGARTLLLASALLGIDHERLTVKYQGLDMRLTGVEKARVVTDILA